MHKKLTFMTIILILAGLVIATLGCAGTPAPTSSPTLSPSPSPSLSPSVSPTSKPTSAPTTPASTSTPTPTPAKVYTIKASSYGSSTDYPPRALMEEFMKLVEQRSGGQIKFDYYPGSSLYNMEDAGKAITAGVIQLAHISAAPFGDKLGARGTAYMSPLTLDWKKFNDNYRTGYLPWFQEAAGPGLNWKVLWYPEHGTTNIISRTPIRTPADFKGKLIRSTAAQKPALELLGASPLPLTEAETFEGLQRGTIDASTGSISSMISLKWTDVAKYIIVIDLYPATIAAIMPLDFYNNLPANLRKIVDDASIEVDAMMNSLVEKSLVKERETLAKDPKTEVIIFTEAQRAELAKMVAPYHADMTKKFGKDWEEFLKIIERDNLVPK